MKFLHTIKGLNIEAGGLTTATYDLVSSLNELGCQTDLLSGGELRSNKETLAYDSFIKVVPFDNRTPLGFAPRMRLFLEQESDYALYHTNGLWVHINHLSAVVAQKKVKPYIISPHGMLYPEALGRHYWKKWLLLKLWFRKDIQRATCLHCTCNEEAYYCRKLGFTCPIAVIPNPVFVPQYIPDIIKRNEDNNGRFGRLRVGFIGRLHPRKRVERLLEAWKNFIDKPDGSELIIIGTGEKHYLDMLQNYVSTYKLRNVFFTGQLEGAEKFEMLATLRTCFVPSNFENFGMIIPEALMVGTPVLASTRTPWQDLNFCHCGWWNQADVPDILKIMRLSLDSHNDDMLKSMGRNGQNLVYHRFASEVVAKKMVSLYMDSIQGKLNDNETVIFK